MIFKPSETENIIKVLNDNQIGVMPTDTIYGIHCKALNNDLIDRIYEIKQRPEKMPFITVINSPEDLTLFDIQIGEFEKEQIEKFWPGPNTLIFKTREGETRSFRIPRNDFLISILNETGPLISTSANLHGQPSAKNIQEAQEYFGDEIDFYVDGGELNNPASSVYNLTSGEIIKLR